LFCAFETVLGKEKQHLVKQEPTETKGSGELCQAVSANFLP